MVVVGRPTFSTSTFLDVTNFPQGLGFLRGRPGVVAVRNAPINTTTESISADPLTKHAPVKTVPMHVVCTKPSLPDEETEGGRISHLHVTG